MRELRLTERAQRAIHTLASRNSPERAALGSAFAALEDESVPLVGPADFAVRHGSSIMGRRVLGTDLVICYIPLGQVVELINVIRR